LPLFQTAIIIEPSQLAPHSGRKGIRLIFRNQARGRFVRVRAISRALGTPGNWRYCLVHWRRSGEELDLFFIRRRGPWKQFDGRKGLDIHGCLPKSVALVAASRAPSPVLETRVEGVLVIELNLRACPYPYPHQVSEVSSLLLPELM
jgi:hypothetical protein